MARPAEAKTCHICGTPNLYWRKVQGPRGESVRLVNPINGDIHPTISQCAKRRRERILQGLSVPAMPADMHQAVNDAMNAIGPVNEPESDIDVNPQQVQDEPVNVVPDSKGNGNDALYNLVRSNVKAEIAEALDGMKGNKVVVHEVNIIGQDGSVIAKIDGCHAMMPKLLRRVSLGLNVLLVGPAGSGKTHAAWQVAEALGKAFYPMSVGPQTSKSDLIGYMDAHGKLVRTVLREAYELGGVFLLDEVDAGNAGVLTVLNALLANGKVSFPDGVIDRHPEFVCIAAANTYGQGANRMYVGRQQLDAATLDRFVGMDWGYDTDLETRMAETQPDWCLYVWSLRKASERLGIRRVFGTRRIQQGTKMLDAGIPLSEVKDETVFFGVPMDERNKLEANL